MFGEFPPQERIGQEEKSERLEGRRFQPPQGPTGKDALENLREGPWRQCQEPGAGEWRREGAQEEQVRLGRRSEEEDLRLQEQVTVAEGEAEQRSLTGGQGGSAVTLAERQALEVALPKGPPAEVKLPQGQGKQESESQGEEEQKSVSAREEQEEQESLCPSGRTQKGLVRKVPRKPLGEGPQE